MHHVLLRKQALQHPASAGLAKAIMSVSNLRMLLSELANLTSERLDIFSVL